MRPSIVDTRLIRSVAVMMLMICLSSPRYAFAAVCQTGSTSFTPSSARMQSRSSGVSRRVEMTSISRKFCRLYAADAFFRNAAAEYPMPKKAVTPKSAITMIDR